MTQPTLAQFLLDRLADRKTIAETPRFDWDTATPEMLDRQGELVDLFEEQQHALHCGYRMTEFGADCSCDGPAYVIADCEAKRRLIELGEKDPYWDDVLRLLAAPFADHPDYHEGWKA